jgi:hypothetical protein
MSESLQRAAEKAATARMTRPTDAALAGP